MGSAVTDQLFCYNVVSKPQLYTGLHGTKSITSPVKCLWLSFAAITLSVVYAILKSGALAISSWLLTHDTSPVLGTLLPHKDLVINGAVKDAIEE